MSKAFVDTTVLFDALVKPGETGKAARSALNRYDETLLPLYAIKELKAGPLRNFVWFHNKLATTRSFYQAINILQKTALTPRKYQVATALEALALAAKASKNLTTAALKEQYGELATEDAILCAQYRLAIHVSIMKAWKKRRKLTTRVVDEVGCYEEAAPYEKKGLIEVEPTRCVIDDECVLAKQMKTNPEALRKLVAAIDSQPAKAENQRRRKVLKEMRRIPKHYTVRNKECRAMGDAVFAFFAPTDAVILTTNIADHGPLAKALGKTVEQP